MHYEKAIPTCPWSCGERAEKTNQEPWAQSRAFLPDSWKPLPQSLVGVGKRVEAGSFGPCPFTALDLLLLHLLLCYFMALGLCTGNAYHRVVLMSWLLASVVAMVT